MTLEFSRIYLTLLSDNYAIHLKQKLSPSCLQSSFPCGFRKWNGRLALQAYRIMLAKTILISNFCVLLCEHNSGFNSTYILQGGGGCRRLTEE